MVENLNSGTQSVPQYDKYVVWKIVDLGILDTQENDNDNIFTILYS